MCVFVVHPRYSNHFAKIIHITRAWKFIRKKKPKCVEIMCLCGRASHRYTNRSKNNNNNNSNSNYLWKGRTLKINIFFLRKTAIKYNIYWEKQWIENVYLEEAGYCCTHIDTVCEYYGGYNTQKRYVVPMFSYIHCICEFFECVPVLSIH